MKKNIALVLLLLFLMLLFRGCNKYTSNTKVVSDANSVQWNGEHEIELEKGISSEDIAIPCYSKLVFKTGQNEQRVNIYNPAENNCCIVYSLYCADELIWQSGYCEPGKGYYDIVLSKTMPSGTYQGSMLCECYSMDLKKLNAANVKVTIVFQ